MKKLILALLCLSLVGCVAEFSSNVDFTLEGQVENSSGSPVVLGVYNAYSVCVEATYQGSFQGYDDHNGPQAFGQCWPLVTNQDGKFKISQQLVLGEYGVDKIKVLNVKTYATISGGGVYWRYPLALNGKPVITQNSVTVSGKISVE